MRGISDIEVSDETVTFYFDGNDEPWGSQEFVKDTATRNGLEKIEQAILQLNKYLSEKETVE